MNRKRILFGAVSVLLVVASVLLPQHAWAATPVGTEEMVKKTVSVEVMSEGMKISPTGGSARSVNADPPGGGCYYGPIKLKIDMWYAQGILVYTDNFFTSSIVCMSTDVGQNMTRLTDVAKLYHFGGLQAEDTSQCMHVFSSDPPCTAVYTWGYYQCWGQLNCSGNWSAARFDSLLLPPGWIWNTPTDPRCSLVNKDRELVCTGETGAINVPPVA